MRNEFGTQLEELNRGLISMGALCERAIACAAKAMLGADASLAREAVETEREIDRREKDIENLCLRILLRQQPVARDLRTVSSALKMITDMERIGDQAADIAVPSCGIIDGASDILLRRKRKFSDLAVNVCLDLLLNLSLHLVSRAVDHLDSVVIKRIVAGGNHDPAVKIIGSYNIGDAGRGRDMEQVCVRSGCRDPCRQGVLKHIAAPSRILADHDSRLVILPEIPAQMHAQQ